MPISSKLRIGIKGKGGLHVLQRLSDIRDQILNIFQTTTEADQIRTNTGGIQLLVGHLPVGGRGRMQAAGAGVRSN